jgi:hypothetical protein
MHSPAQLAQLAAAEERVPAASDRMQQREVYPACQPAPRLNDHLHAAPTFARAAQGILKGVHVQLHVWLRAMLTQPTGKNVQLSVKGYALLHNLKAFPKDWKNRYDELHGEGKREWGCDPAGVPVGVTAPPLCPHPAVGMGHDAR